ncbi:MAG TPA: protein translocase subunit SecF [Bacillota bacterium]|nr:protein translocase subunit SecF [Bacillota bacterium]
MNLMKHRWTFIAIFLTTMIASVAFLFVNPYNGWGSKPGSALNLGVDFTGGTKIYYPLSKPVASDDVVKVMETIKLPNFKYNPPQPNQYIDSKGVVRYQVLIYTRFLNDTEQEVVLKALEAKYGKATVNQGLDITRVNPFIGKELVNNAIIAVILASVLMMIYIWWRFEFMSGLSAVIALLHDVLVVLGLFAFFGKEVNANLIAALLTILGYSINDTIVVFDRIRENMKFRHKDVSLLEVTNDSIVQTFRRSLYTGFTSLLAVLVLYITVPNIRDFCFAMIVGITSGTYSSIFVASPAWAVYKEWQEKKKLAGKTAGLAR